jgi:high frequency lysogenization protein
MNLIEERTIALAGLLQACGQVQTIARTGAADKAVEAACLKSIMVLDAMNTPAVYGGIQGVRTGLKMIADGVMSSPQGDKVEVLRYAMSLIQLQNQLYHDQQAFTQFGQAVERLSAVSSDELTQACSDLYQKFISEMRPQIIVQGEQNFLQREDIPPKIRAMLLAGIRSAVLWQQKDGGKFKLIWQRTRMQNAARDLLRQVTH